MANSGSRTTSNLLKGLELERRELIGERKNILDQLRAVEASADSVLAVRQTRFADYDGRALKYGVLCELRIGGDRERAPRSLSPSVPEP